MEQPLVYFDPRQAPGETIPVAKCCVHNPIPVRPETGRIDRVLLQTLRVAFSDEACLIRLTSDN